MRLPNIKFRMLEVRKNETALRKLSCGTTHLPSCALWWEHSVRILYVRASYWSLIHLIKLFVYVIHSHAEPLFNFWVRASTGLQQV